MTTEKPVPHPSELSQPYWDAAKEGRLALQHCSSCQKIRHYPLILCPHCYSKEVHWEDASGRGKIHSWTVAHYAYHPAFAGELPYVIVTVDLEEGVRALGRWSGGDVAIGVPVVARFEPRDGTSDLYFSPA